MMTDQQDDVRALVKDSGESTTERAIARARDVVDRLDNVTLNICVTGESGAGKSSFVNAIRGLKDTDEGAAPTGPTETTMKPTMYPHPTMPNVKIWDLPGIGTPKCKAETYMKDFKFENYDFFIIVSASRFREHDIILANEIKKNKKNFYFVRTKTDIDVTNEKKKSVTEETTLRKIRKYCEENLSPPPSEPPPVFLITSDDLERFDFKELVNTLKSDLPEYKRDALEMSLPVYSKESLDMKYNTLKDTVWAVAFTSGAIAAVLPIPGLSLAWDVPLVVYNLTKYYNAFCLDKRSLENMSQRVNKPIQPLLEEVDKSALVMALATKLITGESGVMKALFRLVPVAGNISAARVSFANTQSVLLEGLNELYSVAKRVIEMAELK